MSTATSPIRERIAFGTMALTDLYNPDADLSEAAQALAAGLDRGVRVLHTAWHYGNGSAYRLVREVAGGHPAADSLRMIVKVDGARDRLADGAEGVSTAASLLGRGGLDAQLVESRPGLPDHTSLEEILDDLESDGPRYQLLRQLRAEGTVARVGIEAYHTGHVRRAVACGKLDFIVCDVSAIRQVVPPHAVPSPLVDGTMELVAIRPLAGGWLTDRYRVLSDFAPADNRREWYPLAERYRAEVAALFDRYRIGIYEGAIRYLASLPYLHTIVVGMRTVAQVEQALDPAWARPLPAGLLAELAALFPQPVAIELD